MTHLVHFKKLESVPSSSLAGMMRLPDDCCRLPMNVNFTEVNTYGLIDVREEGETKDHQMMYTVTITYQTHDRTLPDFRHNSFRLTALNGKQYLLGSHERPYPTVKKSTPTPSKPSESTLTTVVVSLLSSAPLLYIEE